MTDSITRYALIGHPIAHSLSPRIHNAAFKALGLNAVYELRDSKEAGTEETMRRLVREGFAGWNVTMPDKLAAASLCDELSEESRLIGSVNTVLNRNGNLYGTTTDGQGFLYAVRTLGLDPEGMTMTLLGGGGAAVSILVAAAFAGAARIAVFCRSEASKSRIAAVADRLRSAAPCQIIQYSFDDQNHLQSSIAAGSLLANATNVGMGESGEIPVPVSFLRRETAVFDAIYHPAETPLLKAANKAGCQTANGLPMLIGQAAASFQLWTGVPMPISSLPPLP